MENLLIIHPIGMVITGFLLNGVLRKCGEEAFTYFDERGVRRPSRTNLILTYSIAWPATVFWFIFFCLVFGFSKKGAKNDKSND